MRKEGGFKMKKERNEFGLLVMEMAVYVFEMIFAAAAIVGVLYVIGAVGDLLEGFISMGTGLFLIFTFIGWLLYMQFRPDDKAHRRAQGHYVKRPAINQPSCELVRVYSSK